MWEHPLDGSFKEQFGGKAVNMVHHVSTWHVDAGMLLLYYYEDDLELRRRLLPYIDGVLR